MLGLRPLVQTSTIYISITFANAIFVTVTFAGAVSAIVTLFVLRCQHFVAGGVPRWSDHETATSSKAAEIACKSVEGGQRNGDQLDVNDARLPACETQAGASDARKLRRCRRACRRQTNSEHLEELLARVAGGT